MAKAKAKAKIKRIYVRLVGYRRHQRPVYSDTTQLDVELSCVAINGP